MKKYKSILSFSLAIILLSVLAVIFLAYNDAYVQTIFYIRAIIAGLFLTWLGGVIFLCIKRFNVRKLFSSVLLISNAVMLSFITIFSIMYFCMYIFESESDFSVRTSLFENKNVMIIVPHQDDDINIVGGLIEQYTEKNSEVTVVFTVIGDYYGEEEIRNNESLDVLSSLGVKKENIYCLGFGNMWQPQIQNGDEIKNIYNTTDPDIIWTSYSGKTKTYGTPSLNCYLELSYTRNNFLYSLRSIIEEKLPDTIFAVDLDLHADHKTTSLLFEETICNILRTNSEYHPTIYKGFCYGTAWDAEKDYFDSYNLQSTKKPTSTIWAYSWEERLRFPLSKTNLNRFISNNSVYDSLDKYASQYAYKRAEGVLNGDKVFWQRRSDSLIYNAEIFIGDKKTLTLNDFKIIDFKDIPLFSHNENTGYDCIKNGNIHVKVNDTVKANCIYLYDNPDINQNILKGYILLDDGSRIDFGKLEKSGNSTKIYFEEKDINEIEIIITDSEGEFAGLSEIELFHNAESSERETDFYLMAVDEDDNFVYDYTLWNTDTLKLKVHSFPNNMQLCENDVEIKLESSSKDVTCYWENDTLIIKCERGNECKIILTKNSASTTFTVSSPGVMESLYIKTSRFSANLKTLFNNTKDYISSLI